MGQKITFSLLLCIFIIYSSLIFADDAVQTKYRSIHYKTVDTTSLEMRIYNPTCFRSDQTYPAMVFFFGGGWVSGRIEQFEQYAEYFAARGLVTILVDYRVRNRHKTTPYEALKDAKSAIRYVRANAAKLNIDPDKIIAAGGSAGGHLAAACATITDYNEPTDDLSISPIPNALVLYNPVIDNSDKGYPQGNLKGLYKSISPLHNIKTGTPPTAIFLGDQDPLVPVSTVDEYKRRMNAVGSRCDNYIYEGQKHGFFNYKKINDNTYYNKVVADSEKFMQSLGYIKSQD